MNFLNIYVFVYIFFFKLPRISVAGRHLANFDIGRSTTELYGCRLLHGSVGYI